MTIPWFTSFGYGILNVTKDRVELSVLDGCMEVGELRVWESCRPERIVAAGAEIAFARKENTILLAECCTLNRGESLILYLEEV